MIKEAVFQPELSYYQLKYRLMYMILYTHGWMHVEMKTKTNHFVPCLQEYNRIMLLTPYPQQQFSQSPVLPSHPIPSIPSQVINTQHGTLLHIWFRSITHHLSRKHE